MDETVAPAPAAPRSIGERLRAGRERSGLSVAAAAEKLHLDPKVIEALEADRFADLGASVYVRGHLRRYGDFVGEPGAAMVESYLSSRVAPPPPPDLTRIPHAEHRSDPRRLVTPLMGLACAAVLLLAIWWILAGSKTGADKAVNESAAVPVVLPSADPTAPAANEPAAPVPTASPANSGTASNAPAAATATPPKREEATGSRETRLKLALTNDSWVEIYDASGERLFYDVAGAGSVQNVTGRGPLRVVLGNAAGVTVEVDGQARGIPANAADGEGARFVVNRSGSLTRSR
ncbi:MAG TPA: helix-turn-helix domain-containing protein [Steroidobacteraceae bacterium]|nr:helix-turn-helix domain-containing protein [Steroidobacteraceae bacterium]